MNEPFWKTKALGELSEAEWESLCDGCGKCCLHKLEDEETGRVHLTIVACRLLDLESCRCRHYEQRQQLVSGCVRVRPDNVQALALPATCAYRRLAEGLDLPDFHPLITGDPESVHELGMSVRGRAVPEHSVEEEQLEDYVLEDSDEC